MEIPRKNAERLSSREKRIENYTDIATNIAKKIQQKGKIDKEIEELITNEFSPITKQLANEDFRSIVAEGRKGSDALEIIASYYQQHIHGYQASKQKAAVVIPPELEDLVEQIAENSHDLWAYKKSTEQKVMFGPHSEKDKHPDMLPYSCLPDEEKDFDRDTARQNIEFILSQKQYSLRTVAEVIRRHSGQAAATAIMARNLSHNIGSHVVAYWASKELSAIIRSLESFVDKAQRSGFFQLSFLKHPGKAQETIEHSKKLFQYLQHRMDFIAEVSSSVPSSELSMHFRQDLLWPMIGAGEGVPPLLKYLAYSEHLGSVENGLINEILVKTDTDNDRTYVSIPNGVIGAHAIYTIIENFVRNSAKHYKGTSSEEDGPIFKIELTDPSVTKWREKYFEVRLWDLRSGSCNHEILTKLLSYIDPEEDNAKFSNDKGVLDPGGWGLKEMVICANFLRKNMSDELFEKRDKENEPPLLALSCNDKLISRMADLNSLPCLNNSCAAECLGLCFYLRRPKHLKILHSAKSKISARMFDVEGQTCSREEFIAEEQPYRIVVTNDTGLLDPSTDNPRITCRLMPFEPASESFDDAYYLGTYERFIKEKLTQNAEQFPFIMLVGGGYSGFFAENFSKFGKSIKNANELLEKSNREEKYAVYYHHADKAGSKKEVERLLKSPAACYFQPLSGKFSIDSKLKSMCDDKSQMHPLIKEHFILELIESILTEVFILDERVSDFAEQPWAHGITIGEVLSVMRIYVIPVNRKTVAIKDLNSKLKSIQAMNTDSGNINKINIMENDKRRNSFFVVHQGILDKLEKERKGSSETFFHTISCNWKIVDSGRGVPHELFPESRFIEISALLKMLENFDKHAMVQTLFASRNPKTYEEVV